MVEYKRLNPKCQIAMYVRNAMAFAILFVAVYAVWWLFSGEGAPQWVRDYATWMALAVLVAAAVYFVLGPIIYYRRYRYIIDGDKVDVRRGILVIRRSLTPIERIHQVDVTRGPILSMLGLANVSITTAGGFASLSYLEIPEAERVAEELNALVMKILKEGE